MVALASLDSWKAAERLLLRPACRLLFRRLFFSSSSSSALSARSRFFFVVLLCSAISWTGYTVYFIAYFDRYVPIFSPVLVSLSEIM